MCAKNNTHIYVARTSNNRLITAHDLDCCLLPLCEALRIFGLSFPIATISSDDKSATRKLREERKACDCDSFLSDVTVLDKSCIAYLE